MNLDKTKVSALSKHSRKSVAEFFLEMRARDGDDIFLAVDWFDACYLRKDYG